MIPSLRLRYRKIRGIEENDTYQQIRLAPTSGMNETTLFCEILSFFFFFF